MTTPWTLAGDGTVFATTNNGVRVYRAKVTLKHAVTGQIITVTGTGSTKKHAVERRDRNVERRLTKIDPTTTIEALPRSKTRLRARKQGLTLGQFEPTWHSVTGSRTKPQTKTKHSQRLKQWVYPWLDQPMSTLTKTQLEQHFYTTLPNNRAGETSVYDSFCSLKALLNCAVQHGYLKQSPMQTMQMKKPVPKVKETDERLVSKRLRIFQYLVKELADPACPDHTHYPLVLLMGIGMRRAELLGLDWKQISSLERGSVTITIKQQLIRGDEGYYIQPSTKTSKTRSLTLPGTYRKALLEKRERDGGNGLVFQQDGKHWTYSHFNRVWRSILERYMTKDGRELREDDLWRPHVNRKLAATMLAQAGVSVKVAAELLGHDPTVLLKTYHDATREDLKSGAAALANVLT